MCVAFSYLTAVLYKCLLIVLLILIYAYFAGILEIDDVM